MTMTTDTTGRLRRGDLEVAAPIVAFVEDEALPGTGIDPATFWAGFSAILSDLTPRNRNLLAFRANLQTRIDAYHREHPGQPDPARYRAFLTDLGYLVPEPTAATITTSGVDVEITGQAGPQLVVPLLNARFAVNAANARWGSLYDALYGTDAIPDEGSSARGSTYNPTRGGAVMKRGKALLDQVAPLRSRSHANATAYAVTKDGTLEVRLADGTKTDIADPQAFAGYTGAASEPSGVLLLHHGLHVEVVIDRTGGIGRDDPAGVQDIVLESAVSTIMDLEDSVAAVDAEDKALGYHNWRELMQGTLTEQVTKNGRTFTRTLNPDRSYTAPDGSQFALPGRALMFIRNVGQHMFTDAILDAAGEEVPEGIVDAVLTTLGSLPDLRDELEQAHRNSRTGAMYIVKPKQHGPEEVAHTVELLGRVEQLLGLPPRTIKIGIMDEERRTTVNLAACIAAAADRIVFVNTGFLDRTGDEIHTSMQAGAMVRKADMKSQPFMAAYETANVDVGLRAGFSGTAQVGKGMWAMPDLMSDMLEQKIGHVRSGATTAWVPSPTAATLHALHYHDVDAFAVQREIAKRPPQILDPILILPLADRPFTAEEITTELDTNVQSILGYVVRWIDQGVGCSKVPDIHNIALMEDRATLRISSQLLSNWLTHGVITSRDVDESLERLAPVVDRQNAGDAQYEPLIDADGPGLAFQAARSLILDGAIQPNGYTEWILHRYRRAKKAGDERLRHASTMESK